MNFAESSHGGALLEKLRQQQDKGRFCDIVLHVEGRKFRAHRAVLAACSPYFDSVLRMHKTVLEQMNIACKNQNAFQSLLGYMYSGCISINRANAAELLQLSNHFLIFKLKNYCAEYLERQLCLSNCLAVRELAERYNVPLLLKAVVGFIRDNVEAVLDDPRLLRFAADQLVSFLSDQKLGLPRGLPLLTLVTRWVSHDLEEREGQLRFLLTFVDWGSVDCDALSHFLGNEPLFAENRRCLYFFLETLDENAVPLAHMSGEKQERLRLEFSQSAGTVDEESFMHLAVSAAIEGLAGGRGMDEEEGGSTGGGPRDGSEETLSTDGLDEDDEDGRDGGAKDGEHRRQPSLDDCQSSDSDCDTKPSLGILHNLLVEKNDPPEPSPTDDGSADQSNESSSRTYWKDGVKCSHCSYVGYGASRLQQHVSHAHAKDVTFTCALCDFTCKWNREYYTHMKEHFGNANGLPPFRCDACPYKCERIQLLLLHRMKHTDERPFRCGACDYRCRQKTNLVAHMRSHTGERPFGCDDCGRSFALKCTLEQHLQSHRADRPYLCDVCGFTAKYQSHLISHRRLHTGNVFRCQFAGCAYVSPKRSQLEAHTRTHTAVRSHVCPVCGRAFIERSHLVRHERIHLDDKPFKCPDCEYSSSRRDKLKEHHEKHHGENATAKAPYRPRRTHQPRYPEEAPMMVYEEDTYGTTNPSADARFLVVQMPGGAAGLSPSRDAGLDDATELILGDSQNGHLLNVHLGQLTGDESEEAIGTSLDDQLASAVAASGSAELGNLSSFMAFF
ncbi:zinc finger protein, putative [Ixodes scapularis]|uniref:Zinc finger protein, putative n=2 Tax=Ixodes scapularis TaxID=6945 RepID=B7PCQ8_IXOSC|nr:zinc finger protein, putative [Ixodes scapularis]|eukprot:XP_002410132.1 zinc finger protein, putative [Ixodes scapularis]